jgi:hypothetical protein
MRSWDDWNIHSGGRACMIWLAKNIVILALLLAIAGFLRIYRLPQDHAVYDEIDSSLVKGKSYHPSHYFANAEKVCFLRPYATPSVIDTELSGIARLELNLKINDIIAGGDGVAWIVGIKGKEVVFTYKVGGRVKRLAEDKPICVNAEQFTINPVKYLVKGKGSHDVTAYLSMKAETGDVSDIYYQVSGHQ